MKKVISNFAFSRETDDTTKFKSKLLEIVEEDFLTKELNYFKKIYGYQPSIALGKLLLFFNAYDKLSCPTKKSYYSHEILKSSSELNQQKSFELLRDELDSYTLHFYPYSSKQTQ